MALTAKQIALVHIAKKRLDLDDEPYRRLLLACGGVQSSRDLDGAGFDLLMRAFARLGFESDCARRNFGHRRGMASVRQVEFIRRLWDDYTDGKGTDKGLRTWLERTFKVGALRFLDAGQARKVITALKAMNAKKTARDAA